MTTREHPFEALYTRLMEDKLICNLSTPEGLQHCIDDITTEPLLTRDFGWSLAMDRDDLNLTWRAEMEPERYGTLIAAIQGDEDQFASFLANEKGVYLAELGIDAPSVEHAIANEYSRAELDALCHWADAWPYHERMAELKKHHAEKT